MAIILTQSLSVDIRLNSISLEVFSGQILGVIGPNGAGKSTLLNTLAGLEKYSGEICLKDKDYAEYRDIDRARLVSLLPQQIISNCQLSVYDVIALGRIPWNDNNQAMIFQAMQWTETSELAQRCFNQLSGGEKARVWLARALAATPEILLADEPVASLDMFYQIQILNVLKQYAASGKSIVLAIHDLSLAARYCDRLCLMKHGEIIATGKVEQVLTKPLLNSVYQIETCVDLSHSPPIVLAK